MPSDPLAGQLGSGALQSQPSATSGTDSTNGSRMAGAESAQSSPPSISLPKGGGAIRGIGEKFAANPVTGTGSMTVPIATSPARANFGPQLSLSYDSGAGNGPFGYGWTVSIPAITRKTDKGLPQYRDAQESDVYVLSGAEDLVPVLKPDGGRFEDPAPASGYTIHRYRPRIEGLFARIERWTNRATGEIHWRSISRDNITTLYGTDNNSRIFDPADPKPLTPTRIFSWLIRESFDDKGNAIRYEYKEEDSASVSVSAAHEGNRSGQARGANRYLKRIKYCNKTPRVAGEDLSLRTDWLFEVVFDYGEHYSEDAQERPTVFRSDTNRPWTVRQDPFSAYRAAFEVRTYRLCRRVLMFHHFPSELGVADCLVKTTHFGYRESPAGSFLSAVTQSGYIRTQATDGSYYYLKRSLPPLEFQYSHAVVQDMVHDVDPVSLENLPTGLDGTGYQWVDLDGEGMSGILTEQGDGWYYKRNLSPLPDQSAPTAETPPARFGPLELVSSKPSLANLASGRQQFLDLAGDGQLDLVLLSAPVAGFYERTEDSEWDRFTPFDSAPNVAWNDQNLRFVDLTGDGHADVLVSEDEVFTWYPSLAEAGFGPAKYARKAVDETTGPRLVFADGTDSVYLADLSGDGLTDLVRIRNGEVCYWPSLGYGRFGPKVTMDNPPVFDTPDLFDQRRIRLADVDGTGLIDIIYLGQHGIQIHRNQSGNSWAPARVITRFPKIDNAASVQVLDLLGNGTACLVWSSPLPGEMRRPMRYIDLVGGQKPHLMVMAKNNLGAETNVQYAPSTRFYLADKLAGSPWISRLPFPVHCVEKVTVTDKWRGTSFVTTYSYHHGYFDGVEREFRGFGRVEQVDIESFGKFTEGNTASPYITGNRNLYQPPVKTVMWHHTGATLDRRRILSSFEKEYFPHWFEALNPAQTDVLGGFRENDLPEPELDPNQLSTEEWREALRACKGMILRQEVYELDVDALERGEHRRVRLFSTAYHNCRIDLVQPRRANRHAVFLVTESEAITYNYELDLRQSTLTPDPRIAHILNLAVDEVGNVLQSLAVVYPRIARYQDSTLSAGQLDLIAAVQQERHLTYTENRYTNDVDDAGNYRLRAPCELLTYELTGIGPRDADDLLTPDTRDDLYFTLQELQRYRLSDRYQTSGLPVADIPYHQLPTRTQAEKRLVERVRNLFFDQNLTDPLAFGTLNSLGIPFETYKLALTEDLLVGVFGSKMTTDVRTKLGDASLSGYLSGAVLASRFGDLNTTGQYWLRTGIAGFAADAASHFYLPERYTDPFGNVTTIQYDGTYDLFVQSTTDPLQNTVEVEAFDFRVLAPRAMKDINDNLSEVFFDVLGMPAAVALKGKGNEGDSLGGFDDALANPALGALVDFFTLDYDEAEARRLLGNATTRHVYYLGQIRDANGVTVWGSHPPCACGILREQHVAQLLSGAESPIQAAFEYSDGLGEVLVKKAQAEPAPGETDLRWIASGKTILNNKGNPVKQYEPYFSQSGQRFEEPVEVGVTPVLYYDAPGRLIRTEFADGTLSRVEMSPWHAASYDGNDTVLESGNVWYAANSADTASPAKQRAAALAGAHSGTPGVKILDGLGRDVIGISHNRYVDGGGTSHDEKYLTFTKLDIEGKPLWIRDARRNLVMQYIQPPMPDSQATDSTSGFVPCYDIAGNLLFQHSMDAGDRWMLMDAGGKPMLAWDFNEHQTDGGVVTGEERLFSTRYDAVNRPIEQWLAVNGGSAQLVELFAYGEELSNTADARARNLRGRLYRRYDPGGLNHVERLDFKDNQAEVHRTLPSQYKAPVIDWQPNSATGQLENETFIRTTEFDALNRITRLYNWHRNTGSRVAAYMPSYNRRGLLWSETLDVGATKTATGHTPSGTPPAKVIAGIRYNAKGQKELLELGNGTVTRYHYDSKTFRLLQLRTTRPSFDPAFPSSASSLKDPRVLQNLHYAYDPVGNITEIRDDAYEPAFFDNQSVQAASQYTYDSLYRLIKATGRENFQATGAPNYLETPPFAVTFPVTDTDPNALRDYTQSYTYDPVGNLLQMKHVATPGQWTRHYEPAAANNRLLRTWEGTNTLGATQYRYDTHGNTLNLANVAPAQSIRWDYRDMIRALDLQGGGWVYYAYDGGKQRVRKVVQTQTGTKQWERIYLGGLEIYRRYSGGNVVEEIESLHVFGGEQRLLLIEDVLRTNNANLGLGPIYRYQYSNHLGSVGLEVNEQAVLISYEEYHPYGTSAYRARNSGIEAPPSRYRYTGMERDEESGLNYQGARYCANAIARWIACDPLSLADGVNLYQLARSNPVTFTDTSGTQTEEKVVKPLMQGALSNVSTVDEVTFKLIDPATSKVIEGRFDFVTGPKNEFMSFNMFLEAKGTEKSPKTDAQKVYLALFEKGIEIEITSTKSGVAGLKTGQKVIVQTGQNFTIIHSGNLSGFVKGSKEVFQSQPGVLKQYGNKTWFEPAASAADLEKQLNVKPPKGGGPKVGRVGKGGGGKGGAALAIIVGGLTLFSSGTAMAEVAAEPEEPGPQLTSQSSVTDVNAVARDVASELMTVAEITPGGAITAYATAAVLVVTTWSDLARKYAQLHQLKNTNLAMLENAQYMIDTSTGEVFEMSFITLFGSGGAGSLERVATFKRSPIDRYYFYDAKNVIYKDVETEKYYLWTKKD